MLVLWLAFVLTFLDQLVKELIKRSMVPGANIVIYPWVFDLRYVQNTGAAWGIFEGFNGMLVLLSVAVLVSLVVFRKHFLEDTLFCRMTMGLMTGGIAGNLLDRARYGYVIDFLHFHWGPHDFPVFNIADSAICIGVGLYMISQFSLSRRAISGTAAELQSSPDKTSNVP